MAAPAELAGHIDAAVIKAEATAAEIEAFCAHALKHNVRAACVQTSRVELVAARLEASQVKTVALVGFPLGAAERDAKRFETELAIDYGAQEIEFPLNHGRLREGDTRYVLRELRDVAEAADERPVCVVLEPAWLSREDLVTACHLVLDSGADSVSTGSGFFAGPPLQRSDLVLLRQALGPKFAIKASGQIRGAAEALDLLAAGATRIGLIWRGSDLLP